MTHSFFIGVDGGATKCIVRVEDESGCLLGRETGGPANIRLSTAQAWESIYSALHKILASLAISPDDKSYQWHVGMGLAGCEIPEAYEAFLAEPHQFDTLVITSDAHTACLGAHAGEDGAIIVMGTGVVGFQTESGQTTKVSGWGFPHDDEGGGAWLGLEAVRHSLQVLDGRAPASGLSSAVFTHFSEELERLVTWANQANSTAFAELAPMVIHQAHAGDVVAQQLMRQAALAIDKVNAALKSAQEHPNKPLPCVLIGGVAPYLEPYLSQDLRARLMPCQASPDAGAVLLLRDYLASCEMDVSVKREGAHD